MKRCFLVLIPGAVMLVSLAQAKSMFVIDSFKIMVRSQPGEEYRITDQLASDEKVEILEKQDQWVRISFKDGREGWVAERLLTQEKPKAQRIADLEKQLQAQAARLTMLDKENLSLKQEKLACDSTLNTLSAENQRLKQEPYQIMLFLSGAGIFLVGCITALILQSIGRRKRGGGLSFEKGIGL